MKKLLICDKHPFGRLIDLYKWCEYLRTEYEITVICFDDTDHLMMEGVKVKRVSKSSSKIIRGIIFILTCLWHILLFKGTVFVVYFDFCIYLKMCIPWKPMHLDIRTVSVNPDSTIRHRQNLQIAKCCGLYDTISIISESAQKLLGISNAFILPLGSDPITNQVHKYTPLKLLYVGTLSGRRLEDTLKGLALFLKKNPCFDIKYSIIGDGHNGEVGTLQNLINDYGLADYVTLYGRKLHTELNQFFSESNIGISYVPINDYYNVQPPTKTFEYVMSGLFCLATSTSENKKYVSSKNGYLIKDSPEGFCEGIEYVKENSKYFCESDIRNSLKNYSWEKIVLERLIPILKKL